MEAKATNPNFKLESILEAKSFQLENTQICQNQFYVSRITFGSSKSETKHALSVAVIEVPIYIGFYLLILYTLFLQLNLGEKKNML